MGPAIAGLERRVAIFAILALSLASAGCRQGPWTLWQSYSARFVDDQGRVIDPQRNQTTSQGQAYALFFALVANDRPRFDRILEWTNYNLALGDLGARLPARLCGKAANGAWKTLDASSAADADVWIAYTLIEAGRLWSEPGYAALGHKLMGQIAVQEVADLPGLGPMLLPGPVGFAHKGSWTLNPSYLPLFVFERLASVDATGPWQGIADGIPRLIRESARKGYAMDWADFVPGDGFAAGAQPTDPSASLMGRNDSIRVYLWAGMLDGNDAARAEILNSLPSMGGYLASHDAPPESVSGDGIPSETPGSAGSSAAVLPYLRAMPNAGKVLVKQLMRFREQRDPATGMYGKNVAYEDQNLALFATGFLDNRFRFGPRGELLVGWNRR
jgi:endoglucanase